MLENLRKRASNTYQHYRDQHILPSPDIPNIFGPNDEDGDNKLAMFGGKVRVLSNGFSEWSRSKRKSPRRTSPTTSDSRSVPSPGSEDASSSQSELSLPHDMRQPFDMGHHIFPPGHVDNSSRPLVVPSMIGSSSATAPSHFIPGSSSMSPYSPQYSHPQAGPSNYATIPSPVLSTQSYGVSNLHLYDNTFSSTGDVNMDPAAWYAAVNGTFVSDDTCATAPPQYVGGHIDSSQQWVHLMRNSGMFEQPGNISQPSGQNLQPESIPESVNMIY